MPSHSSFGPGLSTDFYQLEVRSVDDDDVMRVLFDVSLLGSTFTDADAVAEAIRDLFAGASPTPHLVSLAKYGQSYTAL